MSDLEAVGVQVQAGESGGDKDTVYFLTRGEDPHQLSLLENIFKERFYPIIDSFLTEIDDKGLMEQYKEQFNKLKKFWEDPASFEDTLDDLKNEILDSGEPGEVSNVTNKTSPSNHLKIFFRFMLGICNKKLLDTKLGKYDDMQSFDAYKIVYDQLESIPKLMYKEISLYGIGPLLHYYIAVCKDLTGLDYEANVEKHLTKSLDLILGILEYNQNEVQYKSKEFLIDDAMCSDFFERYFNSHCSPPDPSEIVHDLCTPGSFTSNHFIRKYGRPDLDRMLRYKQECEWFVVKRVMAYIGSLRKEAATFQEEQVPRRVKLVRFLKSDYSISANQRNSVLAKINFLIAYFKASVEISQDADYLLNILHHIKRLHWRISTSKKRAEAFCGIDTGPENGPESGRRLHVTRRETKARCCLALKTKKSNEPVSVVLEVKNARTLESELNKRFDKVESNTDTQDAHNLNLYCHDVFHYFHKIARAITEDYHNKGRAMGRLDFSDVLLRDNDRIDIIPQYGESMKGHFANPLVNTLLPGESVAPEVLRGSVLNECSDVFVIVSAFRQYLTRLSRTINHELLNLKYHMILMKDPQSRPSMNEVSELFKELFEISGFINNQNESKSGKKYSLSLLNCLEKRKALLDELLNLKYDMIFFNSMMKDPQSRPSMNEVSELFKELFEISSFINNQNESKSGKKYSLSLLSCLEKRKALLVLMRHKIKLNNSLYQYIDQQGFSLDLKKIKTLIGGLQSDHNLKTRLSKDTILYELLFNSSDVLSERINNLQGNPVSRQALIQQIKQARSSSPTSSFFKCGSGNSTKENLHELCSLLTSPIPNTLFSLLDGVLSKIDGYLQQDESLLHKLIHTSENEAKHLEKRIFLTELKKGIKDMISEMSCATSDKESIDKLRLMINDKLGIIDYNRIGVCSTVTATRKIVNEVNRFLDMAERVSVSGNMLGGKQSADPNGSLGPALS